VEELVLVEEVKRKSFSKRTQSMWALSATEEEEEGRT
jgi:hypothetical protein